MKFKVTVEIEGEVDLIALKARALELLTAEGGVTTADGSPAPFGTDVNFVGDPRAALVLLWRSASLNAFEHLLPEGSTITNWNPTVHVETEETAD